jgi:hypothetical protein
MERRSSPLQFSKQRCVDTALETELKLHSNISAATISKRKMPEVLELWGAPLWRGVVDLQGRSELFL